MVKKTHHLKSDNHGIMIYPLTWREIHNMSPDCVINVLCDKKFDPIDYMHKLKDFEEYIRY